MNQTVLNNSYAKPYFPAWKTYRPVLHTWFVLNILLVLAGSAFFVLLLGTIRKSARSSSGLLIAHLASVEFLMLAVLWPIDYLTIYLPQFAILIGPSACPVLFPITSTVMYAGHWTSFCLAINRLCAVTWPLCYRLISTRRAILSTILFCWTVAIFCGVIPFYAGISSAVTVSPVWGFCTPVPSAALQGLLSSTVGMIGPLSCTVVMYVGFFVIMTVSALRRGNKTDQSEKGKGTRSRDRKRAITARTLLAVAVWHSMCIFLVAFPVSIKSIPLFQLWMRTVILFGYAFHPMTFFVLSPEYRRNMKATGCKMWRRWTKTARHHENSVSAGAYPMTSVTLDASGAADISRARRI